MDQPLSSPDTSPLSRRQFTAAVGALATAPLVAPAQKADEPKPVATPADVLTEFVRLRFGKHLADDQLKAIRQNLLAGLGSAERLKQVRLTNSDEPDFVFRADP